MINDKGEMINVTCAVGFRPFIAVAAGYSLCWLISAPAALCAQLTRTHTRTHIDTSDVELLEAQELDVATHRLPGPDRRHDDDVVGSRLSAPHSTPHLNTQTNTAAPLVQKHSYANTTTRTLLRHMSGAASGEITVLDYYYYLDY